MKPRVGQGHRFAAACWVSVPSNRAMMATLRGRIRVTEEQVVDVVEVVCLGCRRPLDDVVDQDCEAAVLDPEGSTSHLIGGPVRDGVRVRAKRNGTSR